MGQDVIFEGICSALHEDAGRIRASNDVSQALLDPEVGSKMHLAYDNPAISTTCPALIPASEVMYEIYTSITLDKDRIAESTAHLMYIRYPRS